MRVRSLGLILMAFMLVASSAVFAQSQNAESHAQWITRRLKEMQSVKVGMSRAELLQVFKEEGGLAMRLQRRYAYRDVQRCEVASNSSVEFWDVTYEFRGVEHHVQMTSPPGRAVTVNGNGEPRET